MAVYPTLELLKRELGTEQIIDDALLKTKLAAALRICEGPTGLERWLEPHVATLYYDERALLRDGRLALGEDLLAVTTLTNGDGSTLGSATYRLEPRNQTPTWYITLLSGSSWSFDVDGEVEVAGVWGWHRLYADAWELSAAQVENATGVAASETSIITDAPSGIGPLCLLRVGAEYMRVTDVSGAGAGTLTVQRGVNGSTAAAHAKDTAIYLWSMMEDAAQIVVRLAAYLYRQKDSQVYDITATPELGVMTIPKGIPQDVRLWLTDNRKLGL